VAWFGCLIQVFPVRAERPSVVQTFDEADLLVVNDAVEMAEELTSNAYKMSFAEWSSQRYDVKTMADLLPEEIVDGPFAQIVRYEGRKVRTSLGSSSYDFYKICLQDHNILAALERSPKLRLFPFALYIVCHELVHVIRFIKFLQAFDASSEEKLAEESRVHEITRAVLKGAQVEGIEGVLSFYAAWEGHLDRVRDMKAK
jgi:hypothetical protein